MTVPPATRAPVRMALIGGGPGSFIGPVHRLAAELDGGIVLVAGAFSRDAEKSRLAGAAFGIPAERAYPDVASLLAAERARPDGAELVAVTTPNATHFAIAQAALAAGFDVISDKPATATLAEAVALAEAVSASGRRYGLTYTYSGYPMVREARDLVRQGELGTIRKVVVEYSQGWLAAPIEQGDSKQAGWRADPAQAGLGGCVADIGVHAFHLAEFVAGVRVSELLAALTSVVPGRVLDDDCNVLLRFGGGAPGVLHASQIATGDRNGMRLRVWGDRGGLDWSHEAPEILIVNRADRPTEVRHAGAPYLNIAARRLARLPTGHPEGFIEAFANIYRDFAEAIRSGSPLADTAVPGIAEGVRGMAFIEAAVASSRPGAGWTALPC